MIKGTGRGMSWAAVTCWLLAAGAGLGAVPSGNELALNLSEAKTPAARKAILGEALGKPHFFRYLRIVEMEQGETGGYPFIALTTSEPSSRMLVKFRVIKSMSLATLKDPPASTTNDAVAVTGVIESLDPEKRVLVLNPVIVRYKDRQTPKVGKEMYYERDSGGIVYSFTGGKEPVNVSKRDADLIQYESKIIAERGKEGWAKFLLDEIAKRDKAAKAERDGLGIFKKESEPADASTAPAVPAPAQNVIQDDED